MRDFLCISAIALTFFLNGFAFANEPTRFLIPVENKTILLDLFLYEPSGDVEAKGVILLIGGSGFTSGGFGGPSKFARVVSDKGYIALEWNKRGIRTNDDLTEVLVDKDTYQSAFFTNLLNDAGEVLEQMSQVYPGLPIFVVGGSEGSIIATHLAETHGALISGVSTFGNMITPFIDIVEQQLFKQAIDPKWNKYDLDSNGSLSESEFQKITKDEINWAILLEIGFSKIDVTNNGELSKSEISKAFIDYYLIDNPNREQNWYDSSQIPADFFKEMFKVKSLFLRASSIKIPTLLMHGEEDWNTPIDSLYRLETLCEFQGLDNFHFKYFKNTGHTPSGEMLVELLKFFDDLAKE